MVCPDTRLRICDRPCSGTYALVDLVISCVVHALQLCSSHQSHLLLNTRSDLSRNPFRLREELLATDFDSHREPIFLALRAIFNLCTVHGQSVTLPDWVHRRFRLIPVHVHRLPNPLPLGPFFDSRLPASHRPGGLLCLFSSPSPSLFSVL